MTHEEMGCLGKMLAEGEWLGVRVAWRYAADGGGLSLHPREKRVEEVP